MKINYNISAIIANSMLNKNDERLNVSSERLSSGYKINHAKDNPSGIAIGKKMRAQIEALKQSNQNASDAISVVETADGALSEVQSVLQRMNELAVKAATGTATEADRAIIDEEVQQLKNEVERIATSTDFNSQTLLDGTFDRRGYTSEGAVSVSYFSDAVVAGEYEISFTATGLGTDEAEITAASLNSTTATGANAFVEGAEVKINDNSITFSDVTGKEVTVQIDMEQLTAENTTVTLDLTDIGTMRVQIGANEGQVLEIRIPQVSLMNMDMENTNTLTEEAAQKAIDEVAKGIAYISSVRSRLGAYQNRLDHTIGSLDITEEEMTSAYSRIMDVDMASEMTQYTNQQVLVQAGTSILSQANERPQQVLQLLQ